MNNISASHIIVRNGATIIDSTIGQNYKISNLEIANSNVIINNVVSAGNIIFSSNYPATLTLNQLSNIDNITTTGNNLHSVAIIQDLATNVTSIGSSTNRLKNIHLLNNNTVTINSNNFYSGVSTQVHNSGTVIFNSDDSFSYNLGTSNYNLSEVNFASNARVIGDVYANHIYVNAGKIATFASTNNRVETLPRV